MKKANRKNVIKATVPGGPRKSPKELGDILINMREERRKKETVISRT